MPRATKNPTVRPSSVRRRPRRMKLNPDLSPVDDEPTGEPEPCFAIREGRLVPLMPRTEDGSLVVPDGRSVLSAYDVADRLGLRLRWVQLIYADAFMRVVVLPPDISYVD